MLTFTPQTEEEIKNGNLLKDGDYWLDIVQATFGHSQAGNPQINLKLMEPNTGRILYCNLNAKFPKIIKHFCDAAKIPEKYKSGNLTTEDCMAVRRIAARIMVKPSYPDKSINRNEVEDFLPAIERLPAENLVKAVEDVFGDTLPF